MRLVKIERDEYINPERIDRLCLCPSYDEGSFNIVACIGSERLVIKECKSYDEAKVYLQLWIAVAKIELEDWGKK